MLHTASYPEVSAHSMLGMEVNEAPPFAATAYWLTAAASEVMFLYPSEGPGACEGDPVHPASSQTLATRTIFGTSSPHLTCRVLDPKILHRLRGPQVNTRTRPAVPPCRPAGPAGGGSVVVAIAAA